MSVDKDLAAQPAVANLPGWTRVGDQLVKSFATDDFRAAAQFVERVATAAEAADRRPDISMRAGVVTIEFPLEKHAGASEADLAFARRIQRLIGDHHHPVGLAGP